MLVTYAVGDVHGALHKLQSLIARCEAHADGRPRKYVFLGDYIDRGPQSADVVRLLVALQAEMPSDVVALMGNHEAMLLAVIDGAMPAEDWLWQGGAATLQSYDVADVGELPRDHVDWLRARPLIYDDGRRFFVHAGVDPQLPLDAQREFRPALDPRAIPRGRPRLRPLDRPRSYAARLGRAGFARAIGSISIPARCSAGL